MTEQVSNENTTSRLAVTLNLLHSRSLGNLTVHSCRKIIAYGQENAGIG